MRWFSTESLAKVINYCLKFLNACAIVLGYAGLAALLFGAKFCINCEPHQIEWSNVKTPASVSHINEQL